MTSLQETQRRFWALATRAPGAGPGDARELFESTPALSAEDRTSIYADMYCWRQVETLAEDFPKVAALLGHEAFHQLAEAYLQAHPSEHPDLGQLGRRLADFLAERGELRSDLADLAALEWARCEVFEAAPAAPAGVELLAGLPPEELAAARLRLCPAVRLLRLQHEVAAVWKALEAGEPAPPPSAAPSLIVVWRKQFEVLHAPLPADEASALERALAGQMLGEICEAFADRPDGTEAALAAVGSWFAEQWIALPESRLTSSLTAERGMTHDLD